MSNHRQGVSEGYLIKHKLRLTGLTSENAEDIRSEIDNMISVDGVWIDFEKHTIKMAYDASRHNIDEMRSIIRKHGADISPDGWNQLKLRWDRVTDSNIKENAAHEPFCCNKVTANRRTVKM